MAHRSRWWLAIGVYAAVVFALSLAPVDVPSPVSRLDKVVHVCEYLLFAWLLVQGVRASPHTNDVGVGASKMRERHDLLWAWIYATSYGLLIELLQALVPWRSADLIDAIANAIGAAIGVWLGDRLPRKS